jgi:AcrR family transcriptional regulator
MLRASAREAGVSHAAPKNHFRDLSGLFSELAALGFDRLSASIWHKRTSEYSARERDERDSRPRGVTICPTDKVLSLR